MSFHEDRFPSDLSFGSIGGPVRRTDVVTLDSGFEERNTPWAHSRRRFDAGVSMRSVDDLQKLIAFFEARRGRMYGFRWKDWSDYKSSITSQPVGIADQVIGIGDGTTTAYQLCKTYRSGGQEYCRKIDKPVLGTIVCAVDGVQYFEGEHVEFDIKTGLLNFHEPPSETAVISAGFEFDVPVRFDTDQLELSAAGFEAGEIPSVPVLEVRI
ncbi:glycoside hydrolase family 24 [Amylibacter marinus]|uniref:Glycoside hydrolase family 24 n=1 Tax=Amylibacter marinus TaxID=1475483 RepID=A0ABQ5VRX8_9RHOB|nr:DUF2460 domain-containing protein [Amylibacter marinus]GLQ34060.1 glycoside hydrolase family 24 [Amylibacter marinus]